MSEGDPCPRDPHDAARLLLPWYVTGRIEAADRAMVEAHLAGCADCRIMLAEERRFSRAVAAPDVDRGWAMLRDRIAMEDGAPTAEPAAAAVPIAANDRGWRWPDRPMLARVAALMLLVGSVAVLPRPERPEPYTTPYRTLSAPVADTGSTGNIVVMFRPDVPERELRAAIQTVQARLVDGPTASDAYLLSVPDAARGGALVALRRLPAVTLAEPLDTAPAS